jgi:hypothetical protein
MQLLYALPLHPPDPPTLTATPSQSRLRHQEKTTWTAAAIAEPSVMQIRQRRKIERKSTLMANSWNLDSSPLSYQLEMAGIYLLHRERKSKNAICQIRRSEMSKI